MKAEMEEFLEKLVGWFWAIFLGGLLCFVMAALDQILQ